MKCGQAFQRVVGRSPRSEVDVCSETGFCTSTISFTTLEIIPDRPPDLPRIAGLRFLVILHVTYCTRKRELLDLLVLLVYQKIYVACMLESLLTFSLRFTYWRFVCSSYGRFDEPRVNKTRTYTLLQRHRIKQPSNFDDPSSKSG